MKPTQESPIMDYYFGEESANHKIISKLRELFLKGKSADFNEGLCGLVEEHIKKDIIERAMIEASLMKSDLDEPTEIVGQILIDHFSGEKNSPLIMIADGTYKRGEGNLEQALIPNFIGLNKPYSIFKNFLDGKDTVDEVLSDMKTLEVLQQYQQKLLDDGFKIFNMESSRFFYVPEKELLSFMNPSDNINLKGLVPYLSHLPEHGLLIDEKVERPSFEQFLKNVPGIFLSYRLKQSPKNKVLRKIFLNERLELNNIICDWSANRIVVKDEKTAEEFQKELLTKSRFDSNGISFKINKISPKDYFQNPKSSGFRGYVNNAIVQIYAPDHLGGSSITVPMEIQIQELENYYRFEIKHDKKDPATRGVFSQTKDSPPLSQKPHEKMFYQCCEGILDEIFGRSTTPMDIKTLQIIR